MQECVVDTGRPYTVARINQAATHKTTMNIPSISTSGVSTNKSGFVIPLMMVVATFPPRRKAPLNSITAAIIIAAFRESAPEPTEVANALATSLAPTHHHLKASHSLPIPKAQKNATTAQHQGIQVYSVNAAIYLIMSSGKYASNLRQALELFENPEELVKVKEDHAWHVEHQKEN